MSGYRDLEVYQEAYALSVEIYASLGRRINRLIFSQKDNRATQNLGDGEVLQE